MNMIPTLFDLNNSLNDKFPKVLLVLHYLAKLQGQTEEHSNILRVLVPTVSN